MVLWNGHPERAQMAHEHARRPLLDDRHAHPEIEQRGRRLVWVARAHRDGDLLAVADGDGRVGQRLAGEAARLRLVGAVWGRVGGPKLRAVVEVVDGDRVLRRVVAHRERGERCRTAGLRRQAGPGGPEHPRGADGVEVELVGGDRHVRRGGLAVEQQGEVVGREDLAERDRRAEVGHGADEAVVDTEAAQGAVDVLAERVRARAGDHRR